MLGGWVDLRSESPEPATPLQPVELPELDNGPHFFYGLQWWFFGALAIFGFFYLIYDEWRGGRGPWGNQDGPGARADAHRQGGAGPAATSYVARAAGLGSESGSDSEGAEESAVDREHHARQE